jgi:hypothetical protein
MKVYGYKLENTERQKIDIFKRNDTIGKKNWINFALPSTVF